MTRLPRGSERDERLRAVLDEIDADSPPPPQWAPLERLAESKATTPTIADVDERARESRGLTYERAVVEAQRFERLRVDPDTLTKHLAATISICTDAAERFDGFFAGFLHALQAGARRTQGRR